MVFIKLLMSAFKVIIRKILITAVPRGVIGDRPGGTTTAIHHRGKKTAVRIFANHLYLSLVTRDVTESKRVTWRDSRALAQLVAAPVVNVNVRKIDVANLFARTIHNSNRSTNRGCYHPRTRERGQ